eukprot:Em0018g657a
MVELGEQTNGSDTTGKNTDGTKDTHQEAGVDNEGKRQAVLKTEDEKAALAQLLGPEIARETNVKEQVKALEEFKKAVKQREDNTASNKDVYAGGSSQYPAVQHYYHHSNSQLGRQSSYTQDPHQDIHQPSVVIPAHGHWAAEQHLGIGSAVIVSNSNPPIGGTIRWIGTIPQANGYVAGVELSRSGSFTFNLDMNWKHQWLDVLMVFGYRKEYLYVILTVHQTRDTSAS